MHSGAWLYMWVLRIENIRVVGRGMVQHFPPSTSLSSKYNKQYEYDNDYDETFSFG